MLISLLFQTLIIVYRVFGAERCGQEPKCWIDQLSECFKWNQFCNGDLCQDVCVQYSQDTSSDFVQRKAQYIDRDADIRKVQLLGTHNSFISNAYGFGIEEIGLNNIFINSKLYKDGQSRVVVANQRLSVTDQLIHGVRHLELDLHFGMIKKSIKVCHWDVTPPNFLLYVQLAQLRNQKVQHQMSQLFFQSNSVDVEQNFDSIEMPSLQTHDSVDDSLYNPDKQLNQNTQQDSLTQSQTEQYISRRKKWNTSNLGCLSSLYKLSFKQAIDEVYQFLQNNPEEFVIIYLDSRVSSRNIPIFIQELVESLKVSSYSDLYDVLFTPRALKNKFNNLYPSMNQLVKHGYRLMFETYDRKKWFSSKYQHLVQPLIFNRDNHWQEFTINEFNSEQCLVKGQRVDGSIQWRSLDTSLSLGPSTLFNTSEPTITSVDLQKLLKCGIPRIALDQFNPKFLQN